MYSTCTQGGAPATPGSARFLAVFSSRMCLQVLRLRFFNTFLCHMTEISQSEPESPFLGKEKQGKI